MYIIGDVHGCYKTLLALLEQIPTDSPICFVGDLIDRGPNSKQIIELVRSKGYYCVKGNHEAMFVNRGSSFSNLTLFSQNGGLQTLNSYTSPADDDILLEHTQWAKDLPLYLEFPDLVINSDKSRHLVVSHSSIARVWKDRYSTDITEYVLWNIDTTHGTLPSSNDIFNVFGHTVLKTPLITDFCANIDTGCVYHEHKGYGNLTALHFPSLKVIQQPYKEH